MSGGLLKLRDYQAASITALHTDWSAGNTRVAVVLPTGAGKTVVFSHLIMQWLTANPGRRVLILVHTEELVMQAYRKLREVAPHLRIGIVKAARNQVTADVIIACVPSLRSARRRAQLRRIGLIVTDECHHAAAPTYRKIYAHFGALSYDGTDAAPEYVKTPAVMAGYTATLARGDDKKLSEVWQSVAYRRDIGFMIRRGYLRDVRGKRIEIPDLELSKVKKSGGDYQAADLGDALEASLAPEIVAEAIAEHAADRSGVAFWPTVSAAYAGADAMNAAGIKTEVVHGGLAPAERREILARLERGDTQWVSNCMVLTEGFDCPRVSCVAVCRPTRSAPLYQQMVGRGLRLWCPEHGSRARIKPEPCCAESVIEALILDVVGASRTHGLASLVDLSEKDLRELPEDVSLIEAEEFEETQDGDRVKIVHDGPVETVEFDPLGRDSKSAWNRTPEGIWFLTVGGNDGRYVFLIPSVYVDPETGEPAPPDTWDVLWASKSAYGAHRAMGATEHRGISEAAAFAWAEDIADDWRMNGWGTGLPVLNTTSKRAAWRRKPASARQLTELKRRKVELPEAVRAWEQQGQFETDARGHLWEVAPICPISAGEASDMIDRHAAGQRIDPIARWAASYRS
jgi:superfamily II DNA or RNA helicase